ncbi:MAG: hypothetical protein RR497_00330 [Oscillospiraceae bacterium]
MMKKIYIKERVMRGLLISKIAFLVVGVIGFALLLLCAGQSDYDTFFGEEVLRTADIFWNVVFSCSLVLIGVVGYKYSKNEFFRKKRMILSKKRIVDIKYVA